MSEGKYAVVWTHGERRQRCKNRREQNTVMKIYSTPAAAHDSRESIGSRETRTSCGEISSGESSHTVAPLNEEAKQKEKQWRRTTRVKPNPNAISTANNSGRA
jgi:hypothetical protein